MYICNSRLQNLCCAQVQSLTQHLQKYSRTEKLQNIQQTQHQKQIPDIPKVMYVAQQAIHR